MDGNRRWAASRHLPSSAGHKAGCDALEKLILDCAELGIKYLTVYAFSTENWKRTEEEIGALMSLVKVYLKKTRKIFIEKGIRFRILGDLSKFADDIREGLEELEEVTKDNDVLVLSCAVNYGGRDEIRRAVTKMIEQGTKADEVSEDKIASYLDTAGMPDPDLLIRTSGELRISNFLLWQIAYSEIYIADVMWPDFDRKELVKAVEAYNSRNRRFGGQ